MKFSFQGSFLLAISLFLSDNDGRDREKVARNRRVWRAGEGVRPHLVTFGISYQKLDRSNV